MNIDLFWAKVNKSPGLGPFGSCWEWTASRNRDGYGMFGVNGRMRGAHRVAYALTVEEQSLQLDHLCRNRACVNPAHLEPVTSAENTRRGLTGRSAGERMRAKTHCPRGHAYEGENLYVGHRGRRCRACRNELEIARRGRQRACRASSARGRAA